jgi:quercetin dioxygenase-like cupin family protein
MPGFRAVAPAVATILVDDERTRVTRWDFEPGAETGHHVHGMNYIVVPVTDMKVRVEDASGVSERFSAAGAAYSRPSGVEHNIINASEAPMAFIEVEIK